MLDWFRWASQAPASDMRRPRADPEVAVHVWQEVDNQLETFWVDHMAAQQQPPQPSYPTQERALAPHGAHAYDPMAPNGYNAYPPPPPLAPGASGYGYTYDGQGGMGQDVIDPSYGYPAPSNGAHPGYRYPPSPGNAPGAAGPSGHMHPPPPPPPPPSAVANGPGVPPPPPINVYGPVNVFMNGRKGEDPNSQGQPPKDQPPLPPPPPQQNQYPSAHQAAPQYYAPPPQQPPQYPQGGSYDAGYYGGRR